MLKGTVSRDFRLLVFFMNQFPPSIWVYHSGHFEFFWKFAEIFKAQGASPVSTTPVANGKNLQAEKFNNFVWAPLNSRVNIYINFCLQVHLRCLQSVLIICHRCKQHKGNWWQICRRCRWHWWCTLTCEYLRKFSKKFEMTLLLFSGAWGKVIHEKHLKQKISWHCPFNVRISNNCATEGCLLSPNIYYFFTSLFFHLQFYLHDDKISDFSVLYIHIFCCIFSWKYLDNHQSQILFFTTPKKLLYPIHVSMYFINYQKLLNHSA